MVLLVLGQVGLVVLLDQVDEVLDALLGLGGGERALPLLGALVVLGDLAAVRRDVGHRRVPVAAREVEGGVALVLLAVLLGDLVHRLEEGVLGLGEGVGAGRLLQHLLVVDRDAGTGVVRHAVLLALEGAGVGEALDPGVRVLVLLGVDLGEGAVEDVLHRLGVAELDDVRELVPAEGGVELLGLVGPALVLDVHLDIGVLLLELRVDVLDQLRPGALGVDHQPDGQVFLAVLGLGVARRLRVPARRETGHHASDTDGRNELALHVTLLREPSTPHPQR